MPLAQPIPAPVSRPGLLAGAGKGAMSAALPRGGMAAPANNDPASSGEDDEFEYRSVEDLRKDYLDYLTSKVDEIEEQKQARHYYHGSHWDAKSLGVLRGRRQVPTTWNRIGRKINGIVGLVERMRSDPKALPRTPKNEDGAEIATQAIRYVLDGNDWKTRDPECLRQCGIDGIAGVELKLIEGDHGDPDVGISEVLGDEYFYNPQSIRFDFADKRYDGIAKWIDIDAAIELFPDKEEVLRELVESGSDLTTNSDREYKWISTNRKRLRLVEEWYKHRGEWCWAFYVSNVLLDQGLSPFKDEKGKTMSRFIMFSAAVDFDGDRYGFVRNLKGPQDALNQSKSKTLHIANSRRLIGEKGAVDDVEIARREWARPDGYVEINPGKVLKPDDTSTDLAAFMKFAEDAANEIEQNGNTNVANLNGTSLTNISGRAIELLRQPGMAELGPFILSYRGWKLRVFRAIWNIIKQHWTAERWIRVANNDGLAQFIQLNGLGLDQYGQPVLLNHIGSLDVDVILEEGADLANLMQDTYELMKTQPPGTFPPQVLIEASQIPRSEKDKLLKMMTPQQQPPDPATELAKKLTLDGLAAQNNALNAEAMKTTAEAAKVHAQVDDVQASAMEKRSRIPANAAKAGKDAVSAHLDAARFALDAMTQAAEQRKDNDNDQPAPQRAAAPALPQGMPLPPMNPPPAAYPPPF